MPMKRTFLLLLCTLAVFHLSARDLPRDIADNLYKLVVAEDSGSLYHLVDEGYDLPASVSSDGYTMNLLEILAPVEPRTFDPLFMNLLDSGNSCTRVSFLSMMCQSAPFPGYVYHPANASLREELTGEIISYHREKGTLQQTDIRPLIKYEQDINTILQALYRGEIDTACRVLPEAVAFAAVHFPQRVDGDFLYRQNTATYERSEFQYLAFIALSLTGQNFLKNSTVSLRRRLNAPCEAASLPPLPRHSKIWNSSAESRTTTTNCFWKSLPSCPIYRQPFSRRNCSTAPWHG